MLDAVQAALSVVQPVAGLLDARRLIGDLGLKRVSGRLVGRDLALQVAAAGADGMTASCATIVLRLGAPKPNWSFVAI